MWPAQLVGGVPDRGEQVRPPDVTDEQRVTGQDPVGHLVAGVLVDQHADRLRGVPGGLPGLQDDLAQLDAFPVGQVPHRELRVRPGAEADPGPRRRRQFEVPGQEVGVEVGVDHPDDLQPVRLGIGEVLRDVAARVDHDRLPRGLVPDQVRRLRETVQVVLREDHDRAPRPSTTLTLREPPGVCGSFPASDPSLRGERPSGDEHNVPVPSFRSKCTVFCLVISTCERIS